MRNRIGTILDGIMEITVLTMVCASPWAFGGVEPIFQFVLYASLAMLLVLWAAKILVQWEIRWKRCAVTSCLAGIFFLGIFQIVSMPKPLLKIISPTTEKVFVTYLPSKHEELAGSQPTELVEFAAGNTISLYPAVTRQKLVRVLAVLFLFMLIRNNYATLRSLRRLSVVALINASLLSFFGIIQHFTSPANVMYWTIPTGGTGFGPFIYRNFYVMYVNMCIGLGFGLLISYSKSRDDHRAAGFGTWTDLEIYHKYGYLKRILVILTDSSRLGVVLAIALIISAVIISECRGGLLVLVCAFALILAFYRIRSSPMSVTSIGISAVIGVILVLWYGFEISKSRYMSILSGKLFQDVRIGEWMRVMPLIEQYPLWGTGYGTFPCVEITAHSIFDSHFLFWDHAHNEYVEALVEGGLALFVLSIGVILLTYRRAHRAYCLQREESEASLIFGGAVALATLIIHSLFEFGLDFPSIVILAVVIGAHLCSCLPSSLVEGEKQSPEQSRTVWFGVAPVGCAVALAYLGLFFWEQGWKNYRIQHLVANAFGLDGVTGPLHPNRRIEVLSSALAMDSGSGRLHSLLGDAYLERYKNELYLLHDRRSQMAHWQAISESAVCSLSAPIPLQMFSSLTRHVATSIWASTCDRDIRDLLKKRDLLPAMSQYLCARDLCPLNVKPHYRIAANYECFRSADPLTAYLNRAQSLAPYDFELHYMCGLVASAEGSYQLAMSAWQRSLQLSDHHLEDILHEASSIAKLPDIVDAILPDNPDILLRSAFLLLRKPEEADARRPILERALSLLEKRTTQLAKDLNNKARILRALGRYSEAIESYRRALAQVPAKTEWRIEYAALLYDQASYREAEQQLHSVLREQPANEEARTLLNRINRERVKRLSTDGNTNK